MRTRSRQIIRKLRKRTSHDELHRPVHYQELGKNKIISKTKKKRDRLCHFLDNLYNKKAENFLKQHQEKVKSMKGKKNTQKAKVSAEDLIFSGKQCSICKDNIKEKEVILRCEHVFHKACLTKWLVKCSMTCPNCRSRVFGKII